MDDLQKQKIELAVAEKEYAAKEFVNSFRGAQRILLIAVIVLLIPIYFVAEYGVSAIYVANFNRTKITAHEAAFTSLPIKVIEQNVLPIKEGSYSYYALVKNQNKDLSASKIPWTVKIFDASGKQIYAATNNFYLLPGDQRYLILPNVRLNSVPLKTTLEFGDFNWVKRLNTPNIVMSTFVRSAGDQSLPEGYGIKAGFTNQSVYTLRDVAVKAVLTDKNGKIIAVTQSFANTVTPKETRDVQLYWPVTLGSQLGGQPQVFAETNPLDPNNLTK